jgi:hypothetical protein
VKLSVTYGRCLRFSCLHHTLASDSTSLGCDNHLCTYVSEEGDDGEGVVSDTPSLLSVCHEGHPLIKRCIGPRNATSPIPQLTRLMYPSVSDVSYEPAPSPSPRFSLTHTRRCIGPRNATSPMTTPARLRYLSVFDSST